MAAGLHFFSRNDLCYPDPGCPVDAKNGAHARSVVEIGSSGVCNHRSQRSGNLKANFSVYFIFIYKLLLFSP